MWRFECAPAGGGEKHVSGEKHQAVAMQPSSDESHHVQPSTLVVHAGDGHGGEDAGGQAQVRVDGRPVLPVSVVSDGGVETGPEHPEEQSPCWTKREKRSVKCLPGGGGRARDAPIMAKTSEW